VISYLTEQNHCDGLSREDVRGRKHVSALEEKARKDQLVIIR